MSSIAFSALADYDDILSSIQSLAKANKEFGDVTVDANERAKKSIEELKQTAVAYYQIAQTNEKQAVSMRDDINKLATANQNYNTTLKQNQSLVDTNNKVIDQMRERLAVLSKEYDNLDLTQKKDIQRKKEIERELTQTTRAVNGLSKVTNEATKVSKAAEGSYNALDNELKQMRATLKSMPNAFIEGTGEINKQNKAAVELAAKIDRANASLVRMDQIQGQFGRNVGNYPKGGFLGSFVGELTGPAAELLTGAGLAAGIIKMGTAIVSVRAEYELLEKQLETTLGNKGVAAEAQQIITNFANKTPHEIADVTSAFNRLVDIGIAPTEKELFQLSNVALSKGKTIEDYVELIADAQQNQFDRLAEFSINAKNNGETVDFTFKGVTTTVKNTTTEINKYLLSLGDLPGIAGQTEAAGKTLSGQWSTLGDTFKGIANEIGEILQPALQWLISTTQQAASGLSEYLKDLRAVAAEKERSGNDKTGIVGSFFQSVFNPHQFNIDATEAEIAANEREIERQKKAKANNKTGEPQTYEEFQKQLEERNKRADEIRKRRLASDKANKEADKKLSEALNKSKATTGDKLADLNSDQQGGLISEQKFIEERLKITLDGLEKREAILKKAGKTETEDYINIQKEKKKADTEYSRSQLQLDLKSNKSTTDKSLAGLDRQHSEGDVSDLSYVDKRHEILVAGIKRDQTTLKEARQEQTELFKATNTALEQEQSDYLDKRLSVEKKAWKDALQLTKENLSAIDQQTAANYETELSKIHKFYNDQRNAVQLSVAQGNLSENEGNQRLFLIDQSELKDELTAYQHFVDKAKQLTHEFIADRIEQLNNWIAYSGASEKELTEARMQIAALEKLQRESDAEDAINVQKAVADNGVAQSDKEYQAKKRNADKEKADRQEILALVSKPVDGGFNIPGLQDSATAIMAIYSQISNHKEKLAARDKMTAEERKADELQGLKDTAQAAAAIGLSIVNTSYQLQQQRTTQQLAEIDKREAYELDSVGNNESAKEFIRKKFDAERKQVQRRQAEAEKQRAMYEIAINTAVAVVKALPNIPLSIIVGALGAASLIATAARPIPQYFTGKNIDGITNDNYAGPAWVGDQGRELWQHDGKLDLVNKPSILNVGRKDIIYPNAMTEHMLQANSIANQAYYQSLAGRQISQGKEQYQARQLSGAINWDNFPMNRFTDAIIEGNKNLPYNMTTFDEHGVLNWFIKGSQRVLDRNKRFNK
ncbi:hypothetical protein [Spirosoma litoris]